MGVERREQVIEIALGQPKGRSLTMQWGDGIPRDGTSRKMREYQIRFCEKLSVKFTGLTRQFPGPTRQQRSLAPVHSITSSAALFAVRVTLWNVRPLNYSPLILAALRSGASRKNASRWPPRLQRRQHVKRGRITSASDPRNRSAHTAPASSIVLARDHSTNKGSEQERWRGWRARPCWSV